MLGSFTFGQFVPGDSLLHRLDPRTKIAGVLAAAVTVILAANWPGFLLAAGFSAAGMLLSGLAPGVFIKGLRSLWLLLSVTFVAQVLFTPGRPLLDLGIVSISREGLAAGGEIFFRLGVLVTIASVLTLTTSPITLAAGLETILAPLRRFGVPAHEVAMMMVIALRFVPTLLQEAQTIIKAQQSRGAGIAGGGPGGWVRGILPLMVPLFAGAIRRAEDLATAMEARCYRGGVSRTRMKRLKLDRTDYAVLGISAAALAGAILLRLGMPCAISRLS